MIILNISAAFICAVLAGMGVGSAGLFVLYLTLVVGIPQIEAQGLNLVFFICASLFSVIYRFIQHDLTVKRLIILSSGGAAGSVAGSLFAGIMPGQTLRTIFGAAMVILGAVTLFGSFFKKNAARD